MGGLAFGLGWLPPSAAGGVILPDASASGVGYGALPYWLGGPWLGPSGFLEVAVGDVWEAKDVCPEPPILPMRMVMWNPASPFFLGCLSR